jgi:MFS family permease
LPAAFFIHPSVPVSVSPQPSNAARPTTDWQAVFAVIAAGVIVSMQVGKLPPLLGLLRSEFGLDLVLGGLVASSVSLVGGMCGIMAGFAGDRIGGRRAIMLGLLISAAGSFAGAFSHSTVLLLAARLVEGLGFVVTVVCGPSLVTAAALPAQRSLALGFWSSYMPLGVTLGMLGALAVSLAWIDWRVLWLAMGLLPLAAALLLPRMTAGVAQPPPRRFNAAVLRRPGPWLLAGCFACYTTQWFSIVTWIPTYLRESGLDSATLLALGVAAVVLVNAVGTTVSAAAMHRGLPRWLIIAAVSLGMGLLGVASFAPGLPVLLKIVLAMAASGFGGMLPAAVLAGVPSQARDPSEIATVNGVVVQLLNIGSFIGPPALAGLVAHFGGWANGRWLLLAAGCIGLLLALGLRMTERGRQP